jgi:outer membrane protein assembly factor BamB
MSQRLGSLRVLFLALMTAPADPGGRSNAAVRRLAALARLYARPRLPTIPTPPTCRLVPTLTPKGDTMIARRKLLATLAALAWLLVGSTAWSAPGDLLWEDRLDVSAFEQAFAVAGLKDQVFVSGFVSNANFLRDFVIRAYDARTGALQWQDRVNKGSDDFASGVLADKGRVFVSGTAFGARRYDWLVRAYDAGTGRRLWENVFDLARRDDFSRGEAIAVGDGLLFLGGFATNAQGNQDWIVRAYDGASGALVWQDQRDVGGFSDGVRSLVFHAGRLFVGGWGFTASSEDIFVRAYDARTGTLLWQRNTPGAPGFDLTFARRVRVHGDRVFVGADLVTDQLALRPLVQAYDAGTGALLWQDEVNRGGDEDFIWELDADGGRVFAVGYGGRRCIFAPSPPSNCDNTVRAYDGATGAVLWERVLDPSGLDDFGGLLVAAKSGTVFVFSVPAPVPIGQAPVGRWIVQAFDSATGQLRWESRGGELEVAFDMVVHHGRLFVPGRSIDPVTGDWDFIVRAYNARHPAAADDDE